MCTKVPDDRACIYFANAGSWQQKALYPGIRRSHYRARAYLDTQLHPLPCLPVQTALPLPSFRRTRESNGFQPEKPRLGQRLPGGTVRGWHDHRAVRAEERVTCALQGDVSSLLQSARSKNGIPFQHKHIAKQRFQLPLAESLDDLKCAILRASEPGRLHAWEQRACGGGVRRLAWKASRKRRRSPDKAARSTPAGVRDEEVGLGGAVTAPPSTPGPRKERVQQSGRLGLRVVTQGAGSPA